MKKHTCLSEHADESGKHVRKPDDSCTSCVGVHFWKAKLSLKEKCLKLVALFEYFNFCFKLRNHGNVENSNKPQNWYWTLKGESACLYISCNLQMHACVWACTDPFRRLCEWQRGLCKEPQRGRSGQSNRRSGQQSVTLNTSPWHRADTLCHRPTHCLSALFTHTPQHAYTHTISCTARAKTCASDCLSTHWPPQSVCF